MANPKSKPLVSILTPVFNANKNGYLETCIKSILDQDYKNIEHIFSDGGSSDGTIEIIKKYAKKYPGRIKLSIKKDNGVGSGLKNAYKISSGEIIGWMDADDFYNLGSVSYCVDIFLKNPDYHFVYGNCNIVDENNNHIGNFIVRDFNKHEWLNIQHYIIFNSLFFRMEVIENCGFVNDLGNDLYFYMSVAKKYKFHRIDRVLSNWRLHNQSISLKPSEREKNIRWHRALEDLILVIRYGGSIFSPRALIFLAVIEPSIYKFFKPLVPLCPNFLKKFIIKFMFKIKRSISMPNRNKNNNYFIPFLNRIFTDR